MPGGSEVCRHLSRIGSGSRQRAYDNSHVFWANPARSVRHLTRGEMPQPPFDPIARDSVAHGTADHKANPRRIIQLPTI
jgi:hypothetical protein